MEGSTTISQESRVQADPKQDARYKICRRCLKGRPEDDFYWHTRGVKRHNICKPCKVIQNRQYRDGTTEEQYHAAFAAQGGACAICGTQTPGAGRKQFAMDHCHKTGKFRGLLCMKCNRALGWFKDSPELIMRAYQHLVA